MTDGSERRQPMPTWQFINYLVLGCCTLYSSVNHFQRHQYGQATFLASGSILFVFLAFYYKKRGVTRSQFERDTPFYFFTEWDWETPPPGWRKAVLTLAVLAWLFGLIAVLFPNPLTLIIALPMSGWFFYQLFRLLGRVRACQKRATHN